MQGEKSQRSEAPAERSKAYERGTARTSLGVSPAELSMHEGYFAVWIRTHE